MIVKYNINSCEFTACLACSVNQTVLHPPAHRMQSLATLPADGTVAASRARCHFAHRDKTCIRAHRPALAVWRAFAASRISRRLTAVADETYIAPEMQPSAGSTFAATIDPFTHFVPAATGPARRIRIEYQYAWRLTLPFASHEPKAHVENARPPFVHKIVPLVQPELP